MTVQELIDRLSNDAGLPRDAQVLFATQSNTEYQLVSVYLAPDGIVWIDLDMTEKMRDRYEGDAIFDDR